MTWHVGIDTGGTFTDLAAIDSASGQRYVTKVPSTPRNPARAILDALDRFVDEVGISLGEVSFFAHGTTVGTNAVLEGKGARAGLLITRNFSGIYEVRGGIRPSRVELIDPRYQKPAPLIPLHLTRYVDERVSYDGSVAEELDADSVRRAIEELRAEGVESLAVLCLFSFMNPSHEQRIGEIAADLAPELRISLSSTVLPVIREYIRLSTTALDAYVGPVVSRYFIELDGSLKAVGLNTGQSYVMQSNGGLMRITLAADYPNEILLSGPASGVVFALELGHQLGRGDLVTLDMGGTSTDISVIRESVIGHTREGKIAGQEIGTPMTEIHTIGAGGGTVAWVGGDGLLKVGPRSAGAEPGPACYGRGGTEPTVTDANVVLGYLDPTRFLGGRMQGDAKLASGALERTGDRLGLGTLETAIGVNRIVNTHMAIGLRLTLEAKGCAPGSFVLAAFGGAGPLHAWRVAEEVGIPRSPSLRTQASPVRWGSSRPTSSTCTCRAPEPDRPDVAGGDRGEVRAARGARSGRRESGGVQLRRDPAHPRDRPPLSAPGVRALDGLPVRGSNGGRPRCASGSTSTAVTSRSTAFPRPASRSRSSTSVSERSCRCSRPRQRLVSRARSRPTPRGSVSATSTSSRSGRIRRPRSTTAT